MGAGLSSRIVAVTGGMPDSGMRVALLADDPDGQRRDGWPQRDDRREGAVVVMPVFLQRRHEIGYTIDKLKR